VDATVQNNGKVSIAIVIALRVQPVEKEDGEVMVNMQERYLAPVAFNDHEHGVDKVECLRQIEAMRDESQPIFCEVMRVANLAEAAASIFYKGPVHHPSTK